MPRETISRPLFDGTVVTGIPESASQDEINAKMAKADALVSKEYQDHAAREEQANNFAYSPSVVGDRIFTGQGSFPNTAEGHVAALQSHASVHGPVTQGGKIFSGSDVYDDTPSNHQRAGLDYATGGLKQFPDWLTGASGNNPNSVADIGARVFSDAYTGTGNAILGGYNAVRQSPLVPGNKTYQPIQEFGPALRESLGAKELPADAPAWQRIAEGGASAALNPIGGAIKLVRGAVSEAPTVASAIKSAVAPAVGTATSYLGGLGLDQLAGDYIGHPLARFLGGVGGAFAPSGAKLAARTGLPTPTGPEGPSSAAVTDAVAPSALDLAKAKLADIPSALMSGAMGAYLGGSAGAEVGHPFIGGGAGGLLGSAALTPYLRALGTWTGAQPWYSGPANVVSNVYRSIAPTPAESVAPAMAQPAQQPPQQTRPLASFFPAPPAGATAPPGAPDLSLTGYGY